MPRSSNVVAEDQDYLVFTVVLFKRVVDNFKTAARQKGFQVCGQGRAWPVLSWAKTLTVDEMACCNPVGGVVVWSTALISCKWRA